MISLFPNIEKWFKYDDCRIKKVNNNCSFKAAYQITPLKKIFREDRFQDLWHVRSLKSE